MQRRAAAVLGAFFLVLALGSYGMIAAASPPSISVANPDYRLANDSQFSAAGVSYHVTVSDGSATLGWTVPEAEYSADWADGDTVAFQGTNYTVSIPDAADPQVVELTEARPLPDGVETTEVNGTEYAVIEGEDDSRELVPVGQYLNETYGPAEERQLQEGETYDYRGNQSTLQAVENESATLTWTAPRAMSESLSEGDTFELGDEPHVAHFPNPELLFLDSDVEAYEAELATVDTYEERINGLWGVSILSGLTVITLLALSYLPSRY
jgi:hypothetical protein